MSFWRTFGFHTTPPIETLLSKEGVTLEDVLNDDDLLTECRSQNKKLLDFLSQPDNLRALVNYVTQPQDPEMDATLRIKYPYLAAEILCTDSYQILDALFEDTTLLDSLFAFLKEDPTDDEATGHSVRVVATLISRKVVEALQYMHSQTGIVSRLVVHLASPHVLELLLRLLACSEQATVMAWFQAEQLVPQLVARMSQPLSADAFEHTAVALIGVVGAGESSPSSPLLQELLSEQSLVPLLNATFAAVMPDRAATAASAAPTDPSDPSSAADSSSGKLDELTQSYALLQGLAVAQELLRVHQREIFDSTLTCDELPVFMRIFATHIPQLNAVLTTPPVLEGAAVFAMTRTVVPVGFCRLRVLEVILALLRCNCACLNVLLPPLLASALDLFFEFHLNNFLHSLVEQLCDTILHGEDRVLLRQLFAVDSGCRLVGRLLDAAELVKREGEENLPRRGYMGHLYRIAVRVSSEQSSNPDIAAACEAEGERWTTFVQFELAESRLNEVRAAGRANSYSSEHLSGDDDDDDDDQDYLTSESIFIAPIGPQGFIQDFPDEIGVESDELDENDDDIHPIDIDDFSNDSR